MPTSRSRSRSLSRLIAQRLAAGPPQPARREVLRGAGAAALAFVGAPLSATAGTGTAAPVAGSGAAPVAPKVPARQPARTRPARLGFAAVPKGLADTVTVPPGYRAQVLLRLGDPLAPDVPEYRNDGTDPAESFTRRAGDHHDGIAFFGLGPAGHDPSAVARGLLALNHESITPAFLHPHGRTVEGSGAAARRTSAEDVLREMRAHGVSVVEVRRDARGAWQVVRDSRYNRRIDVLTPMHLSGPAAGHALMRTRHSADGRRTRGTLNNCAHGVTPWGTYLTCEENWAGYFRRLAAEDDPRRSAKELAGLRRYGVQGAGYHQWATATPDTPDQRYGRFDAQRRGASADGSDDYRNEPNHFGWVVEIDPFDPASVPRKRTALGRFAHEGAWPARAVPGEPLVFYMGDDAADECIYKFVSHARWDPADATRGLAAGDKYLDAGTLYVARFEADGTGRWIELVHGRHGLDAGHARHPFADPAEVLIHARLAADAVGATKMDRPEWGAVDPLTGAVYMTLTNHAGRALAATDAANPRHYVDRRRGAAASGNVNGHIVRWIEPTPDATRFRWDVFLFGARASADPRHVNVSALSDDNDFSSPDGLWFSTATGLLWIQTDDGAMTDESNCMLLAALPGTVGDGGPRTIVNTDATGQQRAVTTAAGAPPGERLKRFMVGPVQCEITGLAETPDGRALFVNVQHPGERMRSGDVGDPAKYPSHWPDGGTARPRSATLVITRDDGGPIGI